MKDDYKNVLCANPQYINQYINEISKDDRIKVNVFNLDDTNDLINFMTKIIKNGSKDNTYNVFYTNSILFEIRYIVDKIDALIVLKDKGTIIFEDKLSIINVWELLKETYYINFSSKSLIMFNNFISAIPKIYLEEEYRKIIINRLKDIYDLDFILGFKIMKNGYFQVEYCYGIDDEFKKAIESPFLMKKNASGYDRYYENRDRVKNDDMRVLFQRFNIQSCILIYAEHHSKNGGLICVGTYGEKKIDKYIHETIINACKIGFNAIEEYKNYIRLESKVMDSERFRVVMESAAGIAHDINNVLSPIIGITELIKGFKIEDKRIEKYINIIHLCANDGIEILNKVKKFTSFTNSEGTKSIFNIEDIITDAISIVNGRLIAESSLNNIKVSISTNMNKLHKVSGFDTEIREVFINLITNAIDAMPKGGTIYIATKKIRNNVVIELKDSGTGMNSETLDMIFEPFFTTKGDKGSGLGLPVTKKIINLHGGEIRVYSVEGKGTTFQIELPICNEDEVEIITDEKEVDFHGNILIIDDQYQIRNIIGEMINKITNCNVVKCDNQDFDNEISNITFDIVISDLCMPNRDGIQIGKIVKNINPNIFFCIMTGWFGNINKNNEVDYVLNKPIDMNKIFDMFDKYNKFNSKIKNL